MYMHVRMAEFLQITTMITDTTTFLLKLQIHINTQNPAKYLEKNDLHHYYSYVTVTLEQLFPFHRLCELQHPQQQQQVQQQQQQQQQQEEEEEEEEQEQGMIFPPDMSIVSK